MGYSLDFRKQVLKVKEAEGLTNQATSERFGISIRTLFRWQNRLAPKHTRNKPSTKIDMDKLEQDIESSPDAYQYERAARLGVSTSCVFYALKRLNVTCKKNTSPS